MQMIQTHTNTSYSLPGSLLHGPCFDPLRAGGDGGDSGSDGDDDSYRGGTFSITPITISIDTDYLDVEYTPPFDLDVEWGDAARDDSAPGGGNSGGYGGYESPNPN